MKTNHENQVGNYEIVPNADKWDILRNGAVISKGYNSQAEALAHIPRDKNGVVTGFER